jgi:signal transduction histidine kinase
MSRDAQDANEWHWLWEVYVVGLCVAAIVAVVLLNHRFPGNVPVAAAALVAIALAVLAFGRWARKVARTRLAKNRVRRSGDRAVGPGDGGVTSCRSGDTGDLPAGFHVIATEYRARSNDCDQPHTAGAPLARPGCALAEYPYGHCYYPHRFGHRAPVIGTVIMASMRQRKRLAALVEELAANRAESARLSREAGAAAERERLAREIHDTPAQGFTSIVALAQAVEPELDSDTAAAKRHVDLIRSTARENLAEARAMVAELTPTALHDGSLPAAIQRQCDRLSASSGITATMRVDGGLPPLGMAADVVLLRAAQEAFANIRKHSQASAVTVSLLPVERGVRLSVADNGIGRSVRSLVGRQINMSISTYDRSGRKWCPESCTRIRHLAAVRTAHGSRWGLTGHRGPRFIHRYLCPVCNGERRPPVRDTPLPRLPVGFSSRSGPPLPGSPRRSLPFRPDPPRRISWPAFRIDHQVDRTHAAIGE